MENLQQIVIQETTAPYVRALSQYGNDLIPENQIEIIYSELNEDEKLIWDNFILMIKSKV